MKVPLSDIYVDERSLSAVSRVLESKRYILGDENASFEKEFARKTGSKHAIAVSSGTAALFLSMLASGLHGGDEVLVPSFSFIATASPVVDVGAKPVFCDVDPQTLTLDPSDARKKITPRTKAIVPVHLFGHPSKMDEITEIAEDNSLDIIEDCAQAHGAMFHGKNVGAFGITACYSFYPSKNVTVYGDGGMVTTNDTETAEEIRMLRNHGRVEKYLHQRLGYNFRLSEIAASLGRLQLERLEDFNDARRQAARYYNEKLDGTVTVPTEQQGSTHVFHMYVIRTPLRDQLKEFLSSRGIETGVHYPIPIHLQPPFKNAGDSMSLPITEGESKRVLSLPIFPTISNEQLQYVADEIETFFGSSLHKPSSVISVPPVR